MKCPYNRISSRQIYRIAKTYNDDNLEVNQEYNFNENHQLMDCLKEECGVYRSGRCCYNETYKEVITK